MRPQAAGVVNEGELISNVAVIKLERPRDWKGMAQRIESEVGKLEVVDRKTAYENSPGYSAQMSTLNTMQYFTLFIGILVIGGFFQIQTLQKVAQIGMLKAIGATNRTVGWAAVLQIITINAVGVGIGAVGTVALIAAFPAGIPIVLTGQAVITAVSLLLLIGPLGGLASVFAVLGIEPLRALCLAQ